ncbi:hypothetical protein H8K52_06695 [Undibacterium seohonense]|uniref:Uncharacterized protein n=1 Tax=Undibacterium seohonense TaxID=1344950 RepID=A0ABR6X2F9_9BURK|nr:hypothetical protein [Undibacterium seohonense]MBC3807030.1 hypothetical protein [Undibacterium seohonense]
MPYERLSSLLSQPSKERSAYNKLRETYLDLASLKKNEFTSLYRSSISNFDELIQQLDSIMSQLLASSVDHCMTDLVSLGIYDVSDETFISKFWSKYNTWESDTFEVRNIYAQFMQASDSFETGRRLEGQGGPTIVGGGFGVDGAVQGMAVAGAANLAISAINKVGNSIGSAIDGAELKGEKEKYFKNPDLIKHLSDRLEAIVFSLHLAVVDLVNSRSFPEIVYQFPTEVDVDRSNAILANLESGRVANDQAKILIPQALELNPHNPNIYKYWIRQFGDDENDVEQVSIANVAPGIKEYKIDLIKGKLKSLSLDTPEACIDAEMQITELAHSIGIVEIEGVVSEIRGRLVALQEQAVKVAEAERIVASKGVQVPIKEIAQISIGSASMIANAAIEKEITRRMKLEGVKLLYFYGICGVICLLAGSPLMVIFAALFLFRYFSTRRRIYRELVAEEQVQREYLSFPKGMQHKQYPNVVWDGKGRLDPADGFEWVNEQSENDYSVRPTSAGIAHD